MKHTPAFGIWMGVIAAVVAMGCGSETFTPPYVKDSMAYFPLETGKFIEYDVDSIVFDDAPGGNTKDTIRFQLREEVGQYYLTAMGDTVFYIHRFRRDHAGQHWAMTDVWTSQYDRNKVLRVEENLIFHKMTFPLYRGQAWTATSYIPLETSVRIGTENMQPYQYWDSRILQIDTAGVAGSFTFDQGQLMRIRQVDDDIGLARRYVNETYARGIGLVARTDTILDSRCIILSDITPCEGQPWLVHASKGYILSQVMTGHN